MQTSLSKPVIIPSEIIKKLSTGVDWKKVGQAHLDEVQMDIVYGDVDRKNDKAVEKRIADILSPDGLSQKERTRILANVHWRRIDPLSAKLIRAREIEVAGAVAIAGVLSELGSMNKYGFGQEIEICQDDGWKCRINTNILSSHHNRSHGTVEGEVSVSVPFGDDLNWNRVSVYAPTFSHDKSVAMAGKPLADLIGTMARFTTGDTIVTVTSRNGQHNHFYPATLSKTMPVDIAATAGDEVLAQYAQHKIPNGYVAELEKRGGIIAQAK